ncbi:MAG: hypothetical protein R2726_17630 [Acidimicrobiales bacterium]
MQGRVTEVLEAVPTRVAPPCPFVADGCGGCDLQHLAPAAQPELKVEVVRDALRRLGRVPEPPVRAGRPLPPTGYRTTVRLAVVDGRAGFRRRASHDVLAVDTCLVLHPDLDELVAAGRFDGADEVTLRLGVATGERLVLADPAASRVAGLPADVVVVGVDELAGPDPTAAGRRREPAVHEVVAGRRLRVSARSFFQARPDGAVALVEAVTAAGGDELRAASVVVDAYAGVGLFTAVLGGPDQPGDDRDDGDRPASGARWVAVERSPSAVRDARVNLADVDAEVVEASVEDWSAVAADVVVADPARTGLGRPAAEVLASTGAGVVVLVSCDAAALGRDAALLAEHGFGLESAEVVDLFPHTHHVEVVSRFTR